MKRINRLRKLLRDRRGAITVLSAILLTVMLAFVAFTTDVGLVFLTRTQLQATADASALAGTMELLERSQLTGVYDSGSIINAVQTSVQSVGALNPTGRTSMQIATADIVCGYLADPKDPNSVFATTTPYNSVRVTARRNAQTNGAVNLFFAPAIGTKTADLQATTTATFDGNIQGFRITTSTAPTCKLLPFALDVNTWNQAVAGSGPDIWSYAPTTQAVTKGADRIKEIKLFPFKTNSPGNFGTVNLGQTNNGTAILNRQILYGPNQDDLANMGGQIALGSDGKLILIGNPGISAGISSALISIIGQPRIILLYQPPTALNGANAQFTIVGFAGVIITNVQLTGLAKSVTIQPEIVKDSTAYTGGPITINRFVYRSLKITR